MIVARRRRGVLELLTGREPQRTSRPLQLSFVPGKLEQGETLEEGMARECVEETGYAFFEGAARRVGFFRMNHPDPMRSERPVRRARVLGLGGGVPFVGPASDQRRLVG